jgi:hypothetical protein
MRQPKARPGVEALEGRALLSGGVKAMHRLSPPAVRPAAAAINLSGNWALQGRDPNGTDWLADLVLQPAANGKTLSGYFDWHANALGAYGREYITGTFDPATRLVRLVGTGLQNASGIRLSTYTAVLDPTGKFLTNGTWGTGFVFPANRWTAARARTVESNFDAGTNGWTVSPGTAVLTRPNSGGDPGGFARVGEKVARSGATMKAPAVYSGPWQGGAVVPSLLTFDVNVQSMQGVWVSGPVITLKGPGGSARFTVPSSSLAPNGNWRTYVLALDASTWSVTSGTLAGLLANVTSFTIQADTATGLETIGFDNVRLLAT